MLCFVFCVFGRTIARTNGGGGVSRAGRREEARSSRTSPARGVARASPSGRRAERVGLEPARRRTEPRVRDGRRRARRCWIAGEIAAHLYVPHGRGGVVYGAPLHGLAPLRRPAPAERIALAVHVHVRRHAGRRACQCESAVKTNTFSTRSARTVSQSGIRRDERATRTVSGTCEMCP